MKVYNSGDFIMKEKEIINGYISILKEKERYFKKDYTRVFWWKWDKGLGR